MANENLEDIQMRKVTTTISSIAPHIAKAMLDKTMVYNPRTDKIFALTELGRIELNDDILRSISINAEKHLEKFKSQVEEQGYSGTRVLDILCAFESTNSSYIDTPKVVAARKELHKLLRDARKNGNDVTKTAIELGIEIFMTFTKSNIPKGVRHMKACEYMLNNEKQMEFFRNEYIKYLLEDGVIDFEFLEKTDEVLEGFDLKAIDELLRKTELLNSGELEKIYLRSKTFATRKEILEHYFKEDRNFFYNFANSKELANYIINGTIQPKEVASKLKIDEVSQLEFDLLETLLQNDKFPKNTSFMNFVDENGRVTKYLSKDFMKKLTRENFMGLVFSDKIKYKIPYNSAEYVKAFGKLTVEDIRILYDNGFVQAEDLIKMLEVSSVKVQNEEEYKAMLEMQLDFYDLNRLEELLNENKINEKFIELYNSLMKEHITEEQRKQYFEKFSNDLMNKANGTELLTNLVDIGIDFLEECDYTVSESQLEDLYLEDKVDEQNFLSLYQKGFISATMLRQVFSSEELQDTYQKGKVGIEVLNLLDNRAEVISQEFKNKKIALPEILKLYSDKNGIDIEEFSMITHGCKFDEEDISVYLTDMVPDNKVLDLFENYYISHDALSSLVGRGIITSKQAEEFAQKVSSHQRYEELFNNKGNFVVLTAESVGKPKQSTRDFRLGEGSKRASMVKNDPELQKRLLMQIGFDERVLKLVGYNNSLDGYKVYPSEEHKIMIFINEENVGNATYVMSLEQGMYFLNNLARNREYEQDVESELESTVTKGALRETEHVKVKNASRGWGANIVDAMRKLSPSFKTKLKSNDIYSKQVTNVVDEIKEDYDKRRE